MSILKCKSCGGTLEKEGNIYICQNCGEAFRGENAASFGNTETRTKSKNANMDFSSEKAERVNNLYTVARRAKDDGNDEQAEKYYDMILMEDPNSWEAVFYTSYFSASQTVIGQISAAASKLKNCLNSVFNLIDEYVSSENENACISEVYTRTKDLAELLHSNARNHYLNFKETNDAGSEYLSRCDSVYEALLELGDQLEKRYSRNPAILNMAVNAWKEAITIRRNCLFYGEASQKRALEYSDKIKKYDPEYVGLVFNKGCYVATCVYGSYDCPQVWTLRRYRDNILAKTWYGRTFIHTYYAVSPTLVKWFGNTNWFKKMWKGKLDRMVVDLKNKGVEDTHYTDRSW